MIKSNGDGSVLQLSVAIDRLALTDLNHEEHKQSERHGSPSLLEKLSEEVLLFYILPLCGKLSTIAALATSNKRMRKRCLQSRLPFSAPPIDICIDLYCPLCPLRKQHGTARGAISLLGSFPLSRVRMHCFVTDVPLCLEALSHKGSIESLDLKLTNKSSSCSLDSLLPKHLPGLGVPRLVELILDSSHLQVQRHSHLTTYCYSSHY